MKPSDGRYQTTTKVKVLSPEMLDVREVDGFHLPEDSMGHTDEARGATLSRGLRPWYGIEWKLQELGRPGKLPVSGISANNQKMRGCRDGLSGVGLTHIRGVIGVMPDASKSEGHSKGLALVCQGDGIHRLYTEIE